MDQPPLNPDALGRMFATAMMEVLDAEKLQPGDRLVHMNDMQEVLNRLEKNILAAVLPEVTSVEQWDALPSGTMVRVHFNGNSELVIRCPAGSGAGIGSMSFLGGRHWSDVFTGWNTDKLEIKYIPEVKP